MPTVMKAAKKADIGRLLGQIFPRGGVPFLPLRQNLVVTEMKTYSSSAMRINYRRGESVRTFKKFFAAGRSAFPVLTFLEIDVEREHLAVTDQFNGFAPNVEVRVPDLNTQLAQRNILDLVKAAAIGG